MRIKSPILTCVTLAGILVAGSALRAAGAPTTQPASAPTTTEAPVAPTTQPGDLRAAADERHKHLDKRWRDFNDSMRTNQRNQYASKPVLRTFKTGTLVNFSITGGMLKIDPTDLAAAVPVRVEVEGSKAEWIISRPTGMLANPAAKFAAARPYFILTRFDFDAKDDESWQARMLLTDHQIRLWDQTTYNNTTLIQAPGSLTVTVAEYGEMGKVPTVIYNGHASTLAELRARQPEEFRLYVLPLLARFTDASFLQPGAADIYSAFVNIPADQKVTQELDQLVPQLDADDPAERAAASEKMVQLGAAGVLAALRMDESNLSEEQKLRLKAFIASSRHRPAVDPATQRRDQNFLLDCLESDDPTVRAAAKTELEEQLHQKIDFDPTLTGDAAATAADAVRKQLIPAAPPTTTQPATEPAPQA